MKRLLFILLMLIVSVAGCLAQEKGLFICDAMVFDTTSATRGRILVEVSPTKNQVLYNYGKSHAQTFYLENVVKIIGRDCIVKGRATNMDSISLFYTDGLLMGGVITAKIFVVRTGRCREVRTVFTRQNITSN